MLQASLFDPLLKQRPARVSLHFLFTARHLASFFPQQQQVSHACACNGACGKPAKPALLALCVEQPCNPTQQHG
jgi:hypothetical protein